MVMLATDAPIPTYRVFDDAGVALGRIVLPATERVSGRGAATLFLQRDTPFRRRPAAGSLETSSPLAAH
jgi:hypothetical protein